MSAIAYEDAKKRHSQRVALSVKLFVSETSKLVDGDEPVTKAPFVRSRARRGAVLSALSLKLAVLDAVNAAFAGAGRCAKAETALARIGTFPPPVVDVDGGGH
mmetsp:Transcript_21304/g.66070  ORF Transcript_21304/g.66070 Transcript_21304/m.66070 type:complete len:103 (+) Transcript_21304:261-569(+)